MFFRTTFPSLLALCNIGFTIIVGAAPVPVRASIAIGSNSAQDLESQTIPYYAEGQLRLSAPSLLTSLPPSSPPPSPPPPSSNDSLPLTFMMPKWVTAPYPQSLKNEDRDVFGTTLQGITLAKKHSSMGNNNAGVYSVASFDSSFARSFPPSIAVQNIEPSRLLVKVLKQIDDDMVAEVKALTIVGQFVASGLLRLPIAKSNDVGRIKRSIKTREVRGVGDTSPNDDDLFELKPVIVMLQMPGKPLTHIPEFISEKNLETKRQMMGDTLKLMCDRVGKLALEHRFVHRDNIIGNILVINKGTEVVDVNIIDWGGKYLSSINDDVTWDDLMGWCHNRWAVYVWEASL
ncbi:hypothetical protein C8R41DRAFT_45904 [Lentinula lateritia]|uniref:Protein kinase domain-containing protein n=1 Tax=Lentinula lateritia TaxID=40482 RepID=A0ABQ8V478_9AGAR|nr:hypothetical protein C8R41DRAFT_45904 [Lentinula lateritia]